MSDGDSQSLASVLSAHYDGLTEEEAERLKKRCELLMQEAQDAWPAIEYVAESFQQHVVERLPQGVDVFGALEKLRIDDLFLAWACARGDRVALSEFSKNFNGLVSGALTRFANQGVDVDEAKQRVLERLLLTTEDRNAAIMNYGGQGRLTNFVRTCVVRESLKLLRRKKREPSSASDSGEQLLSLVEESQDVELVALKKRYRDELRQALREALAELPSEEQNFLRYHYVSGLSTRQIASIVGVSFKTVARRLTQIRATLFERTRGKLMSTAKIRKTEFNSIVRLVESQLDLSLERLLGPK